MNFLKNLESLKSMVNALLLEDIGFRMLQPFELYKAQGFPHDYIFSYGHDENNQQYEVN